MNNAIEIKNLTKEYPNFKLDNINLNIQSGTIVGLIGENGAGKTTLIKAILDIVNVKSGIIKIFNKDYKDLSIKDDIGIVLDNTFFPEILNYNDINTILKDIYKTWDSNLFFKLLNDFGIDKKSKIKTLSKGMKKKVEIATALAHHPKILILDEPTSGLDPIVRNEVLDIFLDFIKDEEHTILFSTHITTDLEHIADRIIFIDHGKKIIDKDRDDIFDNYGILKCDDKQFDKLDKEDIIKYKKNRYNYEVLVANKNKIENKYKDVIIDKITLEDLMLFVIKGEE